MSYRFDKNTVAAIGRLRLSEDFQVYITGLEKMLEHAHTETRNLDGSPLYRAQGIANILSTQIDVAKNPSKYSGTGSTP